ncbi:FYN-binding protein 1 [Protopterus annectens]|uniref:FYN-binding protein 1 n=1 Tax=Protopterus annectens TaxID=7888 RepID=UPI001CF9D137|nr:FYN-binding protein 1 [Protopterus annectens]
MDTAIQFRATQRTAGQMDDKPGVKALMARFNAQNVSDAVSAGSYPGKISSSQFGNSSLQSRKSALEKLTNQGDATSGVSSNVAQKPAFPKPSDLKKQQEEKTDPPKPSYLKSNTSAGVNRLGSTFPNQNKDESKPVFAKQLGLKPSELQKDESKPSFPKLHETKGFTASAAIENDTRPTGKPHFNVTAQDNEVKCSFPKPAGFKAFNATPPENEPKPQFPKQPIGQKPSLTTGPTQDNSPKNTQVTRVASSPSPAQYPRPGSFKTKKTEITENENTSDSTTGRFPGANLKPAGVRTLQSPFLNQKEESNTEVKPVPASSLFGPKVNQSDSGTATPVGRFNKPTSFVQGKHSSSTINRTAENKAPGAPKRKVLPSLAVLGPAPPKPSRPPVVNLDKFKKTTTKDVPSKGGISKQAFPPPPEPAALAPLPPSLPSQPPPPPPQHPSTQPPVPSLPPRNIKTQPETTNPDEEESYDDVEFPLPPGIGPNREGENGSDGEMYEDLDTMRDTKEIEKKKEKEEKKKKLEQEKKEQKEKEKKEQEIRKRFKLTGNIEVIQLAKARVDCKGGKNELTVKQGDLIEIIRIKDNPEGKWLGRTPDGSYGYIKTTCVDIDYNSLKRNQQRISIKGSQVHGESEPEVYDDVADNSTSQGSGGSTGITPASQDDEIYDGVDEDFNGSSELQDVPQDDAKSADLLSGLWRMMKGKDEKKKSIKENNITEENEGDAFMPTLPPPPESFKADANDGEVYDDVESQDFPPAPPDISSGRKGGKGKGDEKDPKRLKKIEKEEKEFKKKFKFDGEIKVLRVVQVVPSIANKKWSGKDLPIKGGEALEVIQETDSVKLLCRNDDGKYGYVQRNHLVTEDSGEIYDDVAEGCIYDND